MSQRSLWWFVLLVACLGCGGSSRRMRAVERPATVPSSPSSNGAAATRTFVPVVATPAPAPAPAPEVRPEATSLVKAVVAPPKPKVAQVSESDVAACEARATPLSRCEFARTNTAASTELPRSIERCVAGHVAELYACLCERGSQPHCEFARLERRELERFDGPAR